MVPADQQSLAFLAGLQHFFHLGAFHRLVDVDTAGHLLPARIAGVGANAVGDHLVGDGLSVKFEVEMANRSGSIRPDLAQLDGGRVLAAGGQRGAGLQLNGAVIFPDGLARQLGRYGEYFGRYGLADGLRTDRRMHETYADGVVAADSSAGKGVDILRDALEVGVILDNVLITSD